MNDWKNLPDVARTSAARFGAQPALMRSAASGGGGYSYGKLWKAVESGAATLAAAGLAPGDRVILAAAPQPAWTPALLSILHAGFVAVPVAPALDAERAAAIASFADAKAAVVDGAATFGTLPVIPLARLAETKPKGAPSRTPARQDPALLVFTSGSTANPRAVELTHGNLLANLESMLALRRAAPGDAFLSILPPSHLFELIGGTLGPLACGARVVYPGALLPNRLVAALREERITHVLAVPALLDALFREVRATVQAAGLVPEPSSGTGPGHSAQWLAEATEAQRVAVRETARSSIGLSLRTLIVGGAAVPPAWDAVLAAAGVRLEVGYGLTEASPIVAVGAADSCPAGSVGRALPGVEIRADEGGEILVRGPNVMRGYHKNPEATAAALSDGWLRTGDRGRVDHGGFLYVEGRLKEAMVGATGETIYPEEVEPCYASPLFAEWCVAPARGADGNDVPTLVVLPANPETGNDELQRELMRLRAKAPSRLRVFHVHRATAPLPRTATGKVRRRLLGESLSNEGPPR